ncbi:sulfatase-like hydrolase/transferase, partial [Rhizobium leguminosarum]|uniref:sulfatase-like hydrolase/transferase n=1 Tax=Rhizobium leguminosarum TaxID=384 RepID=UPI003F9E0F00
VFDYLDETGQLDDTLIIFTSDHGEQLGDHHFLGKIGYNDPSFRIPLVIKDAGENARAGSIESGFAEPVEYGRHDVDALGEAAF